MNNKNGKKYPTIHLVPKWQVFTPAANLRVLTFSLLTLEGTFANIKVFEF